MSSSPLLHAPDVVRIFCGGIRSPHRLDHPEGLLVDPLDGAIWCGGEGGQVYRIQPNGSAAECIGTTGGFLLGLCMDSQRRLYLCDLHHSCVVVMDTRGNEIRRLTGEDGGHTLEIPNYAVLSPDERYLYVSNTCRSGGPGIWRFDLESGEGQLWMSESCLSANGLALSPDGQHLYLVESHLPGISRIPIAVDGSAGPKELLIPLPEDEPDGLAFAPDGTLWISIYNPSRIYRYHLDTGILELMIQDDSTDLLHHPTNLAFRGPHELFTANLGAWHLSKINLSSLS